MDLNEYKKSLKKSWDKFSLEEQLANIGAEVGRAAKWQGKDQRLFEGAKFRAVEFICILLDELSLLRLRRRSRSLSKSGRRSRRPGHKLRYRPLRRPRLS